MRYEFKAWQELAWAAGIAVVIYVLGVLVLFDPDKITDWRSWATVLASGSIRAAAGAVAALITKPRTP